MKTLLKLSFVCLLTFFATNMIQAQCNLSMLPQKISEDATSVTYRFTAFSDSPADVLTITGLYDIVTGASSVTCYNATLCTGTVRFSKDCSTLRNRVSCTAVKASCGQLRDGCVVVVNPLSSGCSGGGTNY